MFSSAKMERVIDSEGTTAFAALCGGEDMRDVGRLLLRGGRGRDEPLGNAAVAMTECKRP